MRLHEMKNRELDSKLRQFYAEGWPAVFPVITLKFEKCHWTIFKQPAARESPSAKAKNSRVQTSYSKAKKSWTSERTKKIHKPPIPRGHLLKLQKSNVIRGTINAIEAFGWQILCFKQRDFFEKRLNRARQRSEFYLTEALWNYLWPEFGSAMLKDEKMQFISSGKWHLLKAIVMQRYFIVLTSNMALCRRDLLFKKIVRTKWNLISVITLFADAVKIYIW